MICTSIEADRLKDGDYQSFEFKNESGAQAVIVSNVDGKLIAFSAVCPHASGDFREGEIYRGRAYCPVHNWKFDIKSGRCMGDENYRLKKYAVKILDGQI
ncbi:MAG: Rieske (2Fe-2S) protein, partial [Chloroflexota bacterium]